MLYLLNKNNMKFQEIREKHRDMHKWKKCMKQALVERLEAWWSIEDTINTPVWLPWVKYRPHPYSEKWRKLILPTSDKNDL